jgi:predicted dinucleotide-binding enzyme
LAKAARVVKCFNTTGANNLENPNYGDDRPMMFLCGNDAGVKSVVMKLGQDVGFEMIDAGELATARLLEPVAMLWIHLAFRGGLGRNFAFKLLRR